MAEAMIVSEYGKTLQSFQKRLDAVRTGSADCKDEIYSKEDIQKVSPKGSQEERLKTFLLANATDASGLMGQSRCGGAKGLDFGTLSALAGMDNDAPNAPYPRNISPADLKAWQTDGYGRIVNPFEP